MQQKEAGEFLFVLVNFLVANHDFTKFGMVPSVMIYPKKYGRFMSQ